MSLPTFYRPEVEAHQIPEHALAAIGADALEHRARLLDDLIPAVIAAVQVYDCAVRLCFYDVEANLEARRKLVEVCRELDRVDYLMLRSSFALGEG